MDKIEIFNKQFKADLQVLLNSHCIENECDVPDFLLAEMIINFIQAVGEPIKKTLDWHGCDSVCHPRYNSVKTELCQPTVDMLNPDNPPKGGSGVPKMRPLPDNLFELE